MTAPTGRIHALRHDDLSFDVYDEGPLDGKPVVLLHGFPERSSTWRLVAPVLHDAGMRTFALDQRGYSPGARPSRRRDYRMHLLVGDVVALIERIGGPVHLAGHDWGAAVGWAVTMRRPDLVRSWTAVSVPHPAAFARAMTTKSQRRRSRYMAMFNLPLLPELTARKAGGRFDQSMLKAGMTSDEVARFRTEIVEYGALPHALGWYRALPLLSLDPPIAAVASVARRVRWQGGVPKAGRRPVEVRQRGQGARMVARSRRGIGGPKRRPGSTDYQTKVPTTFLWSDRDIAITRGGAEATKDWVDAPYQFLELSGVSHWIPTQAPDDCAAAIIERALASEVGA